MRLEDAPRQSFVGINGIRTDGSTNTDQILIKLATDTDCNISDFSYDRVGLKEVLFNLRKRNDFIDRIVQQIIANVESLDNENKNINIVAHSFGGLLTIRALQAGLEVNNVFLFSPAVDTDEPIPTLNVHGEVHVIYHPRDIAILFGAGLINHDFGAMGRKGYVNSEENPKVVNVSCCDYIDAGCEFSFSNLFTLNHGNYFKPQHIWFWIDYILSCEY